MSSLLNSIFITMLVTSFVNSDLIQEADECPGCPMDTDITDPKLMPLLTAILAEINHESEVVRVIKAAKREVSAGVTFYVVVFEIRAEGHTRICDSAFVHKPSLLEKQINIIAYNCHIDTYKFSY